MDSMWGGGGGGGGGGGNNSGSSTKSNNTSSSRARVVHGEKKTTLKNQKLLLLPIEPMPSRPTNAYDTGSGANQRFHSHPTPDGGRQHVAGATANTSGSGTAD